MCALAAERGHLECLKYLHENGCPWTDLACSHAAVNDHLACLKYLHQNGCSLNADHLLSLLEGDSGSNHDPVRDYLEKKCLFGER